MELLRACDVCRSPWELSRWEVMGMPEGQLLRQLEAISAEIAEGQSQENVLQRIVGAIHGLGFGRVRLDLLSTDGKTLTPAAWRGFDSDSPGGPVPAESDPDFRSLQTNPVPQIFSAPIPRGCVPVLLQGKVIGKVTVADGSSLNDEYLGHVMPLAHLASLARAVFWAGFLETLQETTRAIIAVRDRHALLTTIVEQSVKLLGAKSGGLYEYRPERDDLTVIADFNRPHHLHKTLRRGEGLAGKLLDSGEISRWTPDYSTCKDRAKTYPESTFGAVLVVLLKWEGKEIGALYVDDTAGREFSEMDIRLLRLFADQAAICLAQSDLFEKDQRKLRRLGLLAQVTQRMVGDLDAMSWRKRLETIAKSAADVLEAETSGVFRVRGNDLVLEASIGQKGIFETGRTRLKIHGEPGEGLTGWIAHSGKLFNDYGESLKNHPAVRKSSQPHTPSGFCYSLLAIPLKRRQRGRGELIGLIRADNKKGADNRPQSDLRFTQEDEEILTIFAEAAVIAIENAELFDRLKEQKDVQERLISSSPDGIIAVDRHGLVTEFNQRAEQILKYPREKVLGQDVSLLYFDAKEPRTIGRMLHEAPDHFVSDYETAVRSSEGERIPIQHSSTWLFDAEGERVGSVGYFEDLRKQQALERRESLLLQASNVVAQEDVLDDGLQKLAYMMVELLGLSFCCILIKEEDRDSLTLRAASRRGDPDWNPGRQRIEPAGWPGLAELLRLGAPAIKESNDPKARPNLEKLSRILGLTADEDIRSLLVVPLKIGDRVVGQLDLGDLRRDAKDAFPPQEIELVSAIAGQITVLVDRMELLEKRTRLLNQLAILHRISDYIQAADKLEWILLTVLTGVTASFGLGFNRAMLMLMDETGEHLVGEMGVGELEERKAREGWKADRERGADNFEYFQGLLESGKIGPTTTTVGKKIGGLRIPAQGDHLFAEVLSSKDFRRIGIEEFARVPSEFLKTFRVTTPLAVVPLVVKGQVIGILVVDNKFNQVPINDESCNELMTFAATAAVAIDNRRLFDQTRSAANKLLDFYRMSEQLIALQEPRHILRKVVEQTKTAAGASWVSVILIDEAGRAFSPIKTGHRFSLEPMDSLPIRPQGISMEVKRTGEAFRIENVDKMRHRINPDLMSRSVRAAICLPLALPGERIGVMWIHYDEPRRFPDSDVAALQLYVNQAAIAYDSARRLERVEDLREFSYVLAEADDMESVLRQIVEGARQVLKADTAVLLLYDERAESFIPEASVHAGDHLAAWHELQRKGPRPQGTALRVMSKGWLLVDDVQVPTEDDVLGPNTREFVDEVGGRGFLGVTLKTGRERLGVLYAIYTKPFQFDDQEKETTLSFANRAALFLKKSKLFQQVQRARETAEVVTRLTLLEDQKDSLKSIVQEIRGALDCGAVVLFKYDQESGNLILPPAMAGVPLPINPMEDQTLVLAMTERDSPYIVPDVNRDDRFRESPFTHDQGIKSCVAIPLKAAGRKVGVMFVNYRNPRRFTADDVSTMELFANQAAVAVRNTQLFEELATKLAEQETLAGLSREILGASSLQETMDRAVEYAARTLDTEFSNIVLPDRDGRLIFSAAVGWEREMVGNFVLESQGGSQTGFTIQQREPVAVFDYSKETRFRVPQTVFDHGIHSGVSAPMFRGREIVGAMLVHTTKQRRFDDNNGTLLSLIANQTAVALERAQQYEKSKRKSAYLAALYEASKAVTNQLGLERRQVLEQIIQPAMDYIVGLQGPGATVGTIQLYDEVRDQLILESAYPADYYKQLVTTVGQLGPRQAILKGEKIGITGRTVLTGEPQLVSDVEQDSDYIAYASATRSELTVPLIDRDLGKVIGVLNVESHHPNAFDKEDQEALQPLAELAVIAIQNTRRFEALRTQTTLAWMGLGNAVGRHELAGQIGIVLTKLKLLENALHGDNPSSTRAEVLLEEIERRLKSFSLEGPSDQANEGLCSLLVNEDLIGPFQERFLENHPGWRQKLTIFCELEPAAQISANRDWLFRVLDILVNNAAQASARHIVLGSRPNTSDDSWVDIYVADDGAGIPENVRSRLLHEPIREGSKGLGTGLLIAQEVIRKYGGTISFEDRKPQGTMMVLSLPREAPEDQPNQLQERSLPEADSGRA